MILSVRFSAPSPDNYCTFPYFLDCYKVWNWKRHKNSFRLREIRSKNHVPFSLLYFFFCARFYMTIMEPTNVKDSKLTFTNCFQLLLKIQYAPQDSDPKWFELRMPSGNRWERKQTKTTSTKAVERSSKKICYTKHKSESRISRLLLLLSAQKKIFNT